MKIHIQIDEITTTHIRGFRDHMMAAGHSAATINLRLHTLVTAFNEAKRQGLIDVNPANGVKVREAKSRRPKKGQPQAVQAERNAADHRRFWS